MKDIWRIIIKSKFDHGWDWGKSGYLWKGLIYKNGHFRFGIYNARTYEKVYSELFSWWKMNNETPKTS